MSSQQVMTNLGPRRKGSARLEPLPFSNGRVSPPDTLGGDPSALLPDGRSPSAHLPPLNRARDVAAEAFDSVLVDDVSPGVSPVRRARKAALVSRSVGGEVDHRTVLQASLALDQKEREMALIRDNKREYGRILLELWVNQVLDSNGSLSSTLSSSQGTADPLKIDASALKGLASYGLTRVELLGAGLSNEAIDRLYRCMYVYTVGFFDVMQDVLSHNEFRTEILSNVWKGFLTIAESALQVSFRSDYLKLYQSQQVAMAELLFAKEQLSEARQDSVNTEQAVAWLTNAHAEERAARQVLKNQLQELQGVLERERQAHQSAVTKYVAEVEERVRLQAQLTSATAKLSEAAVAQVDLIVQRDQLTADLAAAEERALHIVDAVRGVYEALAMEKALKPTPELASSLGAILRTAAAANAATEAATNAMAAAEAAAAAALAAEAAQAAEMMQHEVSLAPTAELSSVSGNPAVHGSDAAASSSSTPRPSSGHSDRGGDWRAATAGVGGAGDAAAGDGGAGGAGDNAATTRGSADGGGDGGGDDGDEGGGGGGGGGAVAPAEIVTGTAAWPLLTTMDAKGRSEATLLYTNLLSDMTKQLYGMWREQTESTSTAVRSLYEVRDGLRASKMREYELQVELDKSRTGAALLQKTLEEVEGDLRGTHAALRDTEEALAALRSAKSNADRHIEDLTRRLEETRIDLETTQIERNRLLTASRMLQSDMDTRDQRIERLEGRLAVARDSLAEVSRAMVVYAKAATAQDSARGYFKRMYLEASKRAGDLQWSLFRTERQVRTLEGKVEHKNSELATLIANSEAAKQASDVVQSNLAGALMDIENKKAMIGSLERALGSAREEIAKLKADLEETVQRAEGAEQELEEAKAEIERQADAMQSLEARLASAGEERARLLKQVERLVTEKAEVERTGKQHQNSLQAEINRRGTEISSLRSEIEGLNVRLEGLTAELGHTREQLERKREKKRKWKVSSVQYSQQAESLRASLAEREGLVADLSARIEPLEVDVAILIADRGRDASSLKDQSDLDTAGAADEPQIDIVAEQLLWDETTHRYLELSSRLEAQQGSMEAARREYESARAAFYEAPTEEGRKMALLGIEAVLNKLRVERSETEAELARLRERQMGIQGRMQAYENAAFKRRMAVLEKRREKTETAFKNELITRLDESKGRVLSLQTSVDQQTAASNAAQNRAARMEIDFIKTEAEMRELGEKLKRTVEFKVELERQVAQYKNMVGFLQAEVSSLSRERDALKTNLQEVDQRIERLTTDVEEAQSAISVTGKRLEAKYEAEKREAVAAAVERQKQLEAKISLCEARIKDLDALNDAATESFRRFLASYLSRRETEVPPVFLWHINRPAPLAEAIYACSGRAMSPPSKGRGKGTAGGGAADAAAGAYDSATASPTAHADGGGRGTSGRNRVVPPPPSLGAALGRVPYSTNFDFERDTVLGFMSGCWSFDVTLVTISQVYVEKLQTDLRAEEGLLGGVAGPRSSLEAVLYDFFTSRFGCRSAAELHLGSFLAAVKRFRGQHPKVRTFARLLGMAEPPPSTPPPADVPRDPLTGGPLPPSAVEFYMALLNRVHARAGPLIAEAAEGFSLVKSKVLSRMAREFLRGSFNTTLDEVAATSDHIRHMALNDDEKAIDLELALEAMLRAFVLQYQDDFGALCATFRTNFENVGRRLVTPDDMLVFLRQLNAEKAAALPPSRALGLYVEACRAAGPGSEHLGREICRAVLESGFVGISTHVTRLEPMRSLPPYDEFELLEESWRLVRVAVEQQVAVIKSHTEQIKCDVVAYVDLARRVDELIGGRDSPPPAWSTYRRLLTMFCANREAVDAILPFDPPIGSIRRHHRHKPHAPAHPADGSGEGLGAGEAGGEHDPGAAAAAGTGAETDDGVSPGPGSAATSRDVSPHDRRRSQKRLLVSHKSMGAALARTSSSGDLASAADWAVAALATNSNAITGEVRRGGKLLVPKASITTTEGGSQRSIQLGGKSRKGSEAAEGGAGGGGGDASGDGGGGGTYDGSGTLRRNMSSSNMVKLQFNVASRKSLMLPGQQ